MDSLRALDAAIACCSDSDLSSRAQYCHSAYLLLRTSDRARAASYQQRSANAWRQCGRYMMAAYALSTLGDFYANEPSKAIQFHLDAADIYSAEAQDVSEFGQRFRAAELLSDARVREYARAADMFEKCAASKASKALSTPTSLRAILCRIAGGAEVDPAILEAFYTSDLTRTGDREFLQAVLARSDAAVRSMLAHQGRDGWYAAIVTAIFA